MEIKYEIKNNFKTINQILQTELKISSRLLYKLIKMQKILLNNKVCDTRSTANAGDVITIDFNYEEDNSNIVPTQMNLDIVFEDDWLLIINKPAGIAIHPSILHYSDSLCNGIRFYFDKIGLKKKVRPVNRLDLNTSGLVVFAKCEYIQECLISQMKNNEFKKEYLAVCNGIFDKKFGTISLPIARKENSIIERCISEDGQPSITHYEVLKDFEMKVNNLERKYCEIFNIFIMTSNSSSINMYGMYELMNEALYLYRNTINYCFGQLSSKEKEESDNVYIHSGDSP